MPVLMSGKEPE